MFLHPSLEIVRGRIYIVGFRSRRFCQSKVCIDWTHESRDGTHHASQVLGRMVGPLLLPWRSPWTSSCRDLLFPKKTYVEIIEYLANYFSSSRCKQMYYCAPNIKLRFILRKQQLSAIFGFHICMYRA
jgi:hypothetical protein